MKTPLLTIAMSIVLLLGLSGCGYVDDGWDPEPPYGWDNTFYDSDLTGCWALYQVNSDYVSGDQVNYLQFYGRGNGRYYYYYRGAQNSERIAYWCQRSVSGTSSLQINIQYENGSPSTMNYWFSDSSTLWMQWRNAQGVQTYVYKSCPAPW